MYGLGRRVGDNLVKRKTKVPTFRVFGGKRFIFADARKTKRLARLQARFLRTKGLKARVIRGTFFGKIRWLVFQRKG